MTVTEVSSWKSFDGCQKIFSHASKLLGCTMKYSVYMPAGPGPFPVLWYLSGLTCNEQNCIQKGGFQQYAAANSLVVICPDTSPRGLGIDGEDESWDFGTGAGFYVNATESKNLYLCKWEKYQMYDYVTKELPDVVKEQFGDKLSAKHAISGHSMGGHGALICALKNPGKYTSASAFSPICAPVKCPWGEKCFSGYLGSDKSKWENYDASVLASKYNGPKLNILIDQGSQDEFLHKGQLLPEEFVAASAKNETTETVYRLQDGYDHSYFFISSFFADHINFHKKYLIN